ncbi:hypothetical protein Bca52824_060845 [Brassica carinata]|uniref:Uncharacterized protein n=1 Tax=Brassica carinata TaxID=52824 RepID=A0A8X7R0S4_BRACI|nr:hypothetical protein Bca52824_060845 [Brassica carinata]
MADPQLEKIDVDVLIISLILGTVAIPTYLAAVDDMTPNRIHSAMFLFAAGVLGSGVATFVRSNIKGRSLIRSFSRCAMVSLLFPVLKDDDSVQPCGDLSTFLEALLWFYVIVDTYYYKEQLAEEEQDEEEDIELGNDDHCCSICHEDVKAFSEVIRLSNCERIRSRFSQLKKDLTYSFR